MTISLNLINKSAPPIHLLPEHNIVYSALQTVGIWKKCLESVPAARDEI